MKRGGGGGGGGGRTRRRRKELEFQEIRIFATRARFAANKLKIGYFWIPLLVG
jgi:hypothetical protein